MQMHYISVILFILLFLFTFSEIWSGSRSRCENVNSVLVLLLLYFILFNPSDNYENFSKSDDSSSTKQELTQKDIKSLKDLAKAYADNKMELSNLRITGNLVVDGSTRCKRNLLAREINAIDISGTVIDGATVKGEIIKDNDNLLVKRGQRIRIANAAGEYQVWNIENDK